MPETVRCFFGKFFFWCGKQANDAATAATRRGCNIETHAHNAPLPPFDRTGKCYARTRNQGLFYRPPPAVASRYSIITKSFCYKYHCLRHTVGNQSSHTAWVCFLNGENTLSPLIQPLELRDERNEQGALIYAAWRRVIKPLRHIHRYWSKTKRGLILLLIIFRIFSHSGMSKNVEGLIISLKGASWRHQTSDQSRHCRRCCTGVGPGPRQLSVRAAPSG